MNIELPTVSDGHSVCVIRSIGTKAALLQGELVGHKTSHTVSRLTLCPVGAQSVDVCQGGTDFSTMIRNC